MKERKKEGRKKGRQTSKQYKRTFLVDLSIVTFCQKNFFSQQGLVMPDQGEGEVLGEACLCHI